LKVRGVLVGVREVGEKGERREFRMGRLRLEWLRFLDQCPYFGWEPSDLWTTVHLELAGVHEDRIGGSTSRSLASRPDGVIEARSEIVDGVA
jgi:hypothetical protein